MTGDVPAWILAAALDVQTSDRAPVASPPVPGGDTVYGPDRDRFTLIVAWEPGSNWRYDADPNGKAVAAVAVRDGCHTTSFGDRDYLRSALVGWRRGRLVVTPDGAAWLAGASG